MKKRTKTCLEHMLENMYDCNSNKTVDTVYNEQARSTGGSMSGSPGKGVCCLLSFITDTMD
jgi:hypothetical protein